MSLYLPRETELGGHTALSLVRIAPGHLQGRDGDSKAWREYSEQSILQGVVTSSSFHRMCKCLYLHVSREVRPPKGIPFGPVSYSSLESIPHGSTHPEEGGEVSPT